MDENELFINEFNHVDELRVKSWIGTIINTFKISDFMRNKICTCLNVLKRPDNILGRQIDKGGAQGHSGAQPGPSTGKGCPTLAWR